MRFYLYVEYTQACFLRVASLWLDCLRWEMDSTSLDRESLVRDYFRVVHLRLMPPACPVESHVGSYKVVAGTFRMPPACPVAS
jgi:hypothetical protein